MGQLPGSWKLGQRTGLGAAGEAAAWSTGQADSRSPPPPPGATWGPLPIIPAFGGLGLCFSGPSGKRMGISRKCKMFPA